jgi:hypothetical protein
MIVSHEHRFVFLKTRKTAGTSVELALSNLAGDDAIVTPLEPLEARHDPRNYEALPPPARPGDPSPAETTRRDELIRRAELIRQARTDPQCVRYIPYFSHMPAWLARAKLGDEIWDGYFKFCFERNPWDKVASVYWWRHRNSEDPPPFEEWLPGVVKSLSDWPLYSIDGELAVDAVGRYEDLPTDLAAFLERVGAPAGDLRLPRAKSGFRRQDDLYSPATVEEVRQVFSREIEMLGYEGCPASLLARA